MLSRAFLVYSGLGLLCLTFGFQGTGAFAAEEDAPPAPEFGNSEIRDRTVDTAAISAYKAAVGRLALLLKQKVNTPQEPPLLMRLAETQHKGASIAYRIVGGKGDLKNYQGWLNQSLAPLNRLISGYPKNPDVPRAYYMRSKVYRETEHKDLAAADLRYLIDNFPKSRDIASAYMSIYDLLIETKDYAGAIGMMKRLNPQPTDPHYTMVLDRLAWAYYYMDDIHSALAQIQDQVAFYRGRPELSRSDSAERERAFNNATLFFSTGTQKKNPDFSVEAAIPFLRKLDQGVQLGRMLVQYAFLLRANGMDPELDGFKKSVLTSGLPAGDASEVLLVVMGNQLNKRRYADLRVVTSELSTLLNDRTVLLKDEARRLRAQKLLTDATITLQGYLLQNRKLSPDTPDTVNMAYALIALYQVILKVPERDPARVVRVTYNLAETCFDAKQYAVATAYYRWIADKAQQPKDLIDDSKLKAIAARYELLREQKLIPGDLVAKNIKEANAENPVPPQVTEWIQWIDRQAAEPFMFEANRGLYSLGRIEQSVERLVDYAKRFPTLKHAIPSAALAVDTFVVSERWSTANRLAVGFMGFPAFRGTDFHKRLEVIASDTSFKMIEELYGRKEFAESLDKADVFLKTYPESRHRLDCLALAANAALALKNKKRAMVYFAPLKVADLRPEVLATALLTSGSFAEDAFDFEAAAGDYRKYFTQVPETFRLKGDDLKALRRKSLLLAWLSGKKSELRATLSVPGVCSKRADETQEDCERFRAIAASLEPREVAEMQTVRGSTRQTQAVWATLVLENQKAFSLDDRLYLLKLVSSAWDGFDPILKYALIQRSSEFIPANLRAIRVQVRNLAKIRPELKADVFSLKKRIKLVEKTETQLMEVAKIPFVRTKATLLNEIAGLYADFVEDLTAISRLKGMNAEEKEAFAPALQEFKLTMEKKSHELRAAAFQVASDGAIEAKDFEGVARAYAADFPAETSRLREGRGAFALPQDTVLDLAFLDRMDSDGGWVDPSRLKESFEGKPFRAQWTRALQEKNWPKVAFMLQIAKDQSLLREPVFVAATAVSFTLAGARAESWLASESLPQALWPRVNAFYSTFSLEKTRPAVEALIAKPGDCLDEAKGASGASLLLDAALWSSAKLDEVFMSRLYRAAGVTPRVPASVPDPAVSASPNPSPSSSASSEGKSP